jgi:hypothetical protein
MHKQALFCGIQQASLGNQSGINFHKLSFLNSITLNHLQSIFYSNKTKISAIKIDKKPGLSVLFSAQKLLYLADTLDNLVFRFPRTLTFQCFGEALKSRVSPELLSILHSDYIFSQKAAFSSQLPNIQTPEFHSLLRFYFPYEQSI